MTESRLMKSGSVISEVAIPIAGDDDGGKKPLESSVSINNTEKKKIKRRGSSFSLFKAALSIVRPPRKDDGGKNKKSLAKSMDFDHEVNSTGNWTKIVGSMRPLHLQENLQSPPPSIKASSSVESLEDLVPRASSSSSPSTNSWATMSHYASAPNLQELDNENESEEEDPDEVFDAITGDEMIDSKAEQFIAQFYMKMKLQNVDSTFDR